jgi:hypothetical protein
MIEIREFRSELMNRSGANKKIRSSVKVLLKIKINGEEENAQ